MRKFATKPIKVLSIALAIIMIFSMISFPSLNAKAAAGTIDDFVERCYVVTLGRPSDEDGFNDWKGQLTGGQAVGVHVAYGFLFSPEYTKQNKNNEDYVTDLYKLFMGREPDTDGFKDWVGQLEAGKSRTEVFAGFANSLEFYNICESYGITAGRWVNGYDRYQVNNVNLFVERLYKVCFGRIGDLGGQKNWVEKLLNKQITGSECARSFIQSTEYKNLGLSDEDYVENLYISLMGRPSDAEGKANWISALASGKTRDEVFAGFVNSPEFANICNTYKIDKGSYTAKDIGTQQQNKKYRVCRREYSNGDYTIIEYKDGGNESTLEARFDKDGKFRANEYIYEHNEDFSEQKYGQAFFEDDGRLTHTYYYREEYNKDGTLNAKYHCDEAWKTISGDYETYEYKTISNSSGSKVLLSRITSYGNNKVMSYKIYEYNENFRISSIKETGSDGSIRSVEEREYYNKKEIEKEDIKKTTRDNYNAFGEYTGKILSEYDGNGNMIKQTWVNSDGMVQKSNEYEYDSNGNNIKTSGLNNQNEKTTYSVRTYNSNNQKTSEISYDTDGKEGDKWTYEYDKNGNMIRQTYISSYLITSTEYEYDGNGNLVRETRKRKLEQNPEENYWIVYKYEEY